MKQGTLNYREYNCPCGGRINRMSIGTESRGFWKRKRIYIYYYLCSKCASASESYEYNVTDRQ